MKTKILVSILFIRNLILENHLAFKVLKLLIFALTILALYFTFFPNILYWAFDYPSDFGRIPMKLGTSAINAILFLFFFLWVFQIAIFIVKSIVLYMTHLVFGTWKWKGFLFIWEQTTLMLFLTISILGYLFLGGWNYGNVSGVLQNKGIFLNNFSLLMNEHETLIFYTSKLSLIMFILSFIHILAIRSIFKNLECWKKKQKK